jgi:hypothetical protein
MTKKAPKFSLSEIEKARRTTAALEGGRRVRRYLITGEALVELLTHGQRFGISNGIPDGSVFRQMAVDFNTGKIAVWVEHETFSVVPTGGICMDGPVVEISRI